MYSSNTKNSTTLDSAPEFESHGQHTEQVACIAVQHSAATKLKLHWQTEEADTQISPFPFVYIAG